MAESSELNPFAAPADFGQVAENPNSSERVLFCMVIIQLIGIVVAVALEYYQIETIIGSGIVYSLIGCIVTYLAVRKKRTGLALTGLSAPAISLFIFVLININGWGPSPATKPVQVISVIYGVVTISCIVIQLTRPKVTTTESTS